MIWRKRVEWSLLWTCTCTRKVRSSARPWYPFVDKAWVRVASVVVVSSVRGVGSSSLRVWVRVVSRGEEEEVAEEERVRVLLGVGVAAAAAVVEEEEEERGAAAVVVLVVLGEVTTCASMFFIDLVALLAAEEGGKGCMHTTKGAGAMRAGSTG
jgi:hypothetical protein